MVQILKAAPIRAQEIEKLKQNCQRLKKNGVTPTMKVIFVGDYAPSQIYTRNKKKFIEKLGAVCEIINLPEDIKQDQLLEEIDKITSDHLVHGCFVQLPLPEHLSHINVGNLIPPDKDVDGFNKDNIIKIFEGDMGSNSLLPCTPKGIITLLEYYNIPIQGKKITIIGRSLIVGKPLSLLMTNYNATVTLCHSKTKDIKEITKNSDIIIAAIGKAKYIDRSFLPKGSKDKIVIIDVGMNHDQDNNLCGDVDFDNVKDFVKAITPVPGGIGPMTILSLAQNLLQAAEKSLLNIT